MSWFIRIVKEENAHQCRIFRLKLIAFISHGCTILAAQEQVANFISGLSHSQNLAFQSYDDIQLPEAV
jgi:hypothetical protein